MSPSGPLKRRQGGVLLHPTSLPSGDLGPDAYHFADFLAAAGVGVWQVLPLGATHSDRSPYQCLSVHAGNPQMISPTLAAERGWLRPELAQPPVPADEAELGAWRRQVCLQAHEGFQRGATAEDRQALEAFCATESFWLDDYALYVALRRRYDLLPWSEWPAKLRDRDPRALNAARKSLSEAVAQERFEQFLFAQQWQALRSHANGRGVSLFGDMPIFVAFDSADVWARREYFDLDEHGRPRTVAGVPPDYFSATGQRWGNPHYRWEVMAQDGYRWWLERMGSQLRLYDLVRIDHFRGFEAYWEIPASEATAVGGHWVKSPGQALFSALHERFDPLPVVAEDLGEITQEVLDLRDRFGLPGMRVLHFAFDGGADNVHLPYNHEPNSVVYTGTHDNDTTLGWFQALPEGLRQRIYDYLDMSPEPMPWLLVRCALASVARLAVIPMQDLLGLDSAHRMNRPGTTEGNWRWRFQWEQVPADTAGRVRHLLELYGRL